MIEGYPGEFVVIARRSGHRWFIGAINGCRDRDFRIPLEFLDPGQEYTATLYFDDPGLATPTRVGMECQTLVSHDLICRKINAGNGLAIILEKKITP